MVEGLNSVNKTALKSASTEIHSPTPTIAYATKLGRMYNASIEGWLDSRYARKHRGRVQLIFTSPPFPLNRKKRYGNKQGEEYLRWLAGLAPRLKEMLTPDGSIVMELGNAWEPGEPVMSTLALKALLRFQEDGALKVCQQFICHNPARLPSPAQWVTVERIRLKDAYTNVWWMSPSSRPYASNREVLKPYSGAMQKLLEKRKYNAGLRPSEHSIGAESFLRDNRGAIPSNVLTFSNTASSDDYLAYCRQRGLDVHPARMPAGLADFFIRFLTRPGDLVLDPFGGSNTTGASAERLERRWVSVEPNLDYVAGSRGRLNGAIVRTAASNGRAPRR